MRCENHPALLSYQKRLDDSVSDACPGCKTAPHTMNHIMENCTQSPMPTTQHTLPERFVGNPEFG
ncbi:hypothetical protein E2C01_065670 [Portunus trituberculatus]|uniref:Uncharacterized protein n=1 Tax=Portunus trituberculatus TaxID=210409 RepID=A0A5B7HSE6_PORTR|nr:hypothetical protein [Portunus trituberculatus]